MIRFKSLSFKSLSYLAALGALVVLVPAMTLCGVSSARPPFEPPDSDRDPGAFIEENAETLGLDQETLSAIRTIVEESKATGDQLHSKLRALHHELKALLSEDSPAEAAVMRKVETIGAVEVEKHKHRLATMLKIRALLTPEQRAEMAQIREESRGRWKHALRENCEADLATFCPNAEDRWSRKQCLDEHRDDVSVACKDAIHAARRARHGNHGGCGEHAGANCPMHPAAGSSEESGPSDAY